MSYADLLDSRFLGIAESPPPELPGELDLQALWFSGAFGRDFTDHRGRKIHITQFGEWNRSSGPDFLHAVVEIDSQAQHGPIELDLTPADWEHHGHGANPAFNEVALHVVFLPATTPTLDRKSTR
ncbi:MAG: DUF2851 family protein, partial [Verrucomicrobiales bacterium]